MDSREKRIEDRIVKLIGYAKRVKKTKIELRIDFKELLNIERVSRKIFYKVVDDVFSNYNENWERICDLKDKE